MRLFRRHSSPGRLSYAQCGEDLILQLIFEQLHIPTPSYLDLGAFDPIQLSNTYFFYRTGSRGVCVEPNPVACARFSQTRSGDQILNIGVATESAESAPFYVLSAPTLSTFSREEAERAQSYGHKLEKTLEVPLLTVNSIIERYFPAMPDFVSLDVEGLDLAILQTLDFERFRPSVWCIETLTYREDNSAEKITPILDLMRENGYFIYADTFINTIFVDERTWQAR